MRPWCLLEIWHAHRCRRPVLLIPVESSGFSRKTAAHLVRNLETELDRCNPGALGMVREQIAHKGASLSNFKSTVLAALQLDVDEPPHPLMWAPHASDHQLKAMVFDLMNKLAEVSGRKIRWKGRVPLDGAADAIVKMERRVQNRVSSRVSATLRISSRLTSRRRRSRSEDMINDSKSSCESVVVDIPNEGAHGAGGNSTHQKWRCALQAERMIGYLAHEADRYSAMAQLGAGAESEPPEIFVSFHPEATATAQKLSVRLASQVDGPIFTDVFGGARVWEQGANHSSKPLDETAGIAEASPHADPDEVAELQQRLHLVKTAKNLIFLQTMEASRHPFLVLELYTAIIHGVPISPILVSRGGYNFMQSVSDFCRFDVVGAAAYPHAWPVALKVMELNRIKPKRLRWAVSGEIPSLISVTLRLGSDSLFAAACDDIIARVESAQASAASESYQSRSNAGFDWAVGIAGVKLVNKFSLPEDLHTDTAGEDTEGDDDGDSGGGKMESFIRVVIRLQAWQRGVSARGRIVRVPAVISMPITPTALDIFGVASGPYGEDARVC
uniref:TIR domain-containing protein n=1 Tax=Prymnesium polylepis TaxID=72548 RepID=A0A7S4N346_9EUKA